MNPQQQAAQTLPSLPAETSPASEPGAGAGRWSVRGLTFAILAIVGASLVTTIALSAVRVGVLLNGASSAAEISAALVSSAIGAVSVVVVVAASAALTLCAAIAAPLSRLAESFERGGAPSLAPRLREAARLEAGVRTLVAEARFQERQAAAEREAQLRGELDRAQQTATGAQARLGEFAPFAEALARLARGDLTVGMAEARESHPLQSKLDQAISLIAKTVLAFSASLDGFRGAVEEMNASAEAYGDEISKLAATTEAALGALTKRSDANAELAAPISDSAALLRALVEDAVLQGAGVRRGSATFGEIRQAAKQIAPILSLVDEVAFQTNMLALNAGVEAARVGEAGRGMGVVAQELRLLAQRAAEAAKQSSALLSRVQADAERGASELSTVESGYVALPERAAKILGVLDRTGLELADGKGRREALRSLSEPFAEAASARIRLKDAMNRETEALESLIGRLRALTARFKLESEESVGFRPPRARASASVGPRGLPASALSQPWRTRGRQNSS